MKIELIAFNCRYSHSCLALFYVRNELLKHTSLQPEIRQFTINDPYYETLLHITGSEAEVLFFSVYIWNADYIKRLIEDIHKATPNTLFVLGGPQAPSLKKTLSAPASVVEGEIEGVDPSFYSDLISKQLAESYKCGSTSDFDYPYVDNDFKDQLQNRNTYYESSRGCPFSCSYCLSSITKGIRSKDLSSIKEELISIIKHAPKSVRFVDRTFNADPKRALEIWKFLLANSPHTICYHFEIAPDIFTEEMFGFLENVPLGFFQFEIGIQSINAETLRAVTRKMDTSKAFLTIEKLLSLNTVHLHIDLILGLPFDDKQNFYHSFRKVFSLKPHYIQMGLLKVLPGTGINSSANDYDIKYCSSPPYQVLSTKWMNHAEIRFLYLFGECVETFYNNRFFKTFFSFLIDNGHDCVSLFEELLNLCLSKDFFILAKTQAFMNEILFSFIQLQNEKELLKELLIYDWLSCGHRFLPKAVDDDLNTIRNGLFKSLPENIPGIYDAQGRKLFFKKTVFYKFSNRFLRLLGFTNTEKNGYIGFLPEQKPGVIKKCNCVCIF